MTYNLGAPVRLIGLNRRVPSPVNGVRIPSLTWHILWEGLGGSMYATYVN